MLERLPGASQITCMLIQWADENLGTVRSRASSNYTAWLRSRTGWLRCRDGKEVSQIQSLLCSVRASPTHKADTKPETEKTENYFEIKSLILNSILTNTGQKFMESSHDHIPGLERKIQQSRAEDSNWRHSVIITINPIKLKHLNMCNILGGHNSIQNKGPLATQ